MRGAFDPNMLLDSSGDENDDVDREEGSISAWPSWEEAVEIAADDDSESRIISHIPGENSSFDLQWGPLDEKDAHDWLSKPSNPNENRKRRETLVVNDIDRFYPPLADWMYETFRFLPNWRMDDGQISLAEQGGGIGPHVDNYDVFLIQMSGTRTWQVGKRKISAQEESDRMIDGLDVRVLCDSSLDDDDGSGSSGSDDQEMEEWIVHPGDLLYLPPRVAHCGTSLASDCMTLSVGCRAPSVSDLVSRLAERLSSSMDDSSVRRYTDGDLLTGLNNIHGGEPGELTTDAKDRAKHLVLDSLTSIISDDEWWDEFFGRYMTEQKRVRIDYPIPLEDTMGEADDGSIEDLPDEEWGDAKSTVQSVLAGKGVLYQAEGIVFAYSSVPSKVLNGRTSHRFFVNGEMWQSEAQPTDTDPKQNCMVRLFQTVSNHRRLDQAALLGLDSNGDLTEQDELTSEGISFVEELVSAGVLYGSED